MSNKNLIRKLNPHDTMKKASILIVSLLLSLTSQIYGQDGPQLRGARGTITSLESSYCNNETNDDIVPNTWESETTICLWGVYTTDGLSHPGWYSVTGTGTSTVLHFNPDKVESKYYGDTILFECTQKKGIISLTIDADITYVYPIPTKYTVTGDTTICPGGTATIKLSDTDSADVQYLLYRNGGYTGLSALGTKSNISFDVTSAGTYTIKARNTHDNGCITDMLSSAIVSLYTAPTPTISGDNSVCIGSSNIVYTTQTGKKNYTWTISDATSTIVSGTDTTYQAIINWNSSGNKTVKVNYENEFGCSAINPSQYNVVVRTLPIPTITGSLTTCQDGPYTYYTQTGGTNYDWQITGGTITSGLGTRIITVNWDSIGTQSLSVTYTDAYGCDPITPTTVNVVVKARPTPTIFGDTAVCKGTTSVIYQTEADQTSYTWTITGGTITSGATSKDATVTWTTVGENLIKVNYTNANGCRALSSTEYTVTVDPLPVPTISGDLVICEGDTQSVYKTETGMSDYAWTISAGGTIESATNIDSLVVTWSGTGTRYVSVTYKNSTGCAPTSPTTKSVNVSTRPTPSITGTDTVCDGSTDVIYTTQNGYYNFDWSISSDGIITSGQGTRQIKVTWTGTGDKKVFVNYENAAGCSALVPASFNVHVKEKPTPTISGSQVFCLDSTLTKTYNTEAGMSNYVWTVSSGGTIVSGENTNTIGIKWQTTGEKIITVNYTNNIGCSAPTPTRDTITINPTPTPVISGLSTVCNGTTEIYTTASGMPSYTWLVPSGGTITNGLGTNAITVTWTSAGARTIELNYTNLYGCIAKTATIDTIQVLAAPTPTITGLATVCEGSTSVVYTTQQGMYNYDWNISPKGTIVNGENTYRIEVDFDTTGVQTLTVNYENSLNCAAANPASKTINVVALPKPSIKGDSTVCELDTITYTTDLGMNNYNWTVSMGGSIVSGQNKNTVVVAWNTSGAQTIAVSYKNAIGCTSKPKTVNVTVSPKPTPTITGADTICVDEVTTYSTESGMSNYNWTIIGGVINSGLGTNTVNVRFTSSGEKYLKVNYDNTSGCSATIATTDTIFVKPITTPTISGSTIVCTGTTGISYTTQSGMSNYIWTISSGGTIKSGQGTNEVIVDWGNTASGQSISVIFDDTKGCSPLIPTSQVVNIVAEPTPSINGYSTGCLNQTTDFTTESGMSNYSWSVTGGAIISGNNTNAITVRWTSTGQQTVSLNYTVAGNCTADTATLKTVTIYTPPTPIITGPDTACANGGNVLYTTEGGMTNYTWSSSGGGVINSGAGTNTIEISWTTSGNKTIYVNYKNNDGCLAPSPTSKKVYTKESPNPTISGTDTLCLGTTGVKYITESGMSNYIWSVSSGGILVSGQGTDTIVVDWTNSSGTQTVSVNYSNTNDCQAAKATIDTIYVSPLPKPKIFASNGGCVGTTTTYTTESGMSNYVWTYTSGATYISGQGTNTLVVKWNSVSTDTIGITYTSTLGCNPTKPTTKIVNVSNPPTVNLTAIDNPTCQGETVNLTATTGLANYKFYINASSINNGSNNIYSTTTLNNNDSIYVVGTSIEGCSSSSTPKVIMTVYDSPTASLSVSPSTSIIEGTNVIFTASGGNDYQFLINDSIVQDYSINETYSSLSLKDNDTILVKVSNANNCIDTASAIISVLDSISRKDLFASDTEYCSSESGVTVYINNPQSGITYELIRKSDNHNFGTGSQSASTNTWANVTTSAIGTDSFKVYGYYPAFPSSKVQMKNTINITQVGTPTAFSMSPTGTVIDCNGGTGYEIKLSNSEIAVQYILYKNGSSTGVIISGTGNEISFGNQTLEGTYTIYAKHLSAGCENTMTGTFTIDLNSTKTIYNLTSTPTSGKFCEGSNGVEIILNGSTNNETYNLLFNNSTIVKSITGNGNSISFGQFTTEGTYTASVDDSGCGVSMNGSVDVIKEAKPTAYTLYASNNGYYCEGTNGISLSLSGQQVGIEYQLMINGTPIGSAITGTTAGVALDFPGTYTDEGLYSVEANISGLDCTTASLNSISITQIKNPKDIAITGDTAFCDLGGSASIILSSTESNVIYKLYLDDIYTGDSIIGNGGQANYTVTNEGTYTIEAKRKLAATTCPMFLSDTINITRTALPDLKNITVIDGTDCSNGTVITIELTQVDVIYTLYNRTTGLPVSGYQLIGDGSDLSFPEIIDTDTYYYIMASNNGCPIELTQADIYVNIPGVVKKQNVSAPSPICEGDNSITLGLDDTESGINYKLYLTDGDTINHTDLLIETIIGDDNQMNFSTNITEAGEYYVLGINTVTSCENRMTNSPIISFNPLPKTYDVITDGLFCDATLGTSIRLNSTEVGTVYHLQLLNSDYTVNSEVSQITGSGSAISFNNIATEGKYNVYAESSLGCTSNMNDTVDIIQKNDPTLFTISVDNSAFCNGGTGADMFISGTENGAVYIITDLSTNDTIQYPSTADNSSPVKIATLDEGYYTVSATWGNDACEVSLTSTPINISKANEPSSNIKLSLDASLICNGDSTYLRVNNIATGAFYDLVINGINQNRYINSATDSVKWKVSGPVDTDVSFKVYTYSTGYISCGKYSDTTIVLSIKKAPEAYSLVPSNSSYCKGATGATISVNNSQDGMTYELYDGALNLLETYSPPTGSAGSAFSFTSQLLANTYSVKARYNTGNCSASMNNNITITVDDSSMTCFPFEVNADTLFLTPNSSKGEKYVSTASLGGNDVLNSTIDINLQYNLITSWVDLNGNSANTEGDVEFDSNTQELFNYYKSSNFYGRDSVIYEIVNLDHQNRKDTAIIYIFVGNEELEENITILIPNAFTPNGDGKNDLYVIEEVEGQESSELQVFNRWGAIVYRSEGENYLNNWDGTANIGIVASGKDLPVGTYFFLYNVSYKLDEVIKSKKFSGYIELRR